MDQTTIEQQVIQFLKKHYKGSSLAPNKIQFEAEVYDIVLEATKLGSFNEWLRRFNEEFNEEQKAAKSL